MALCWIENQDQNYKNRINKIQIKSLYESSLTSLVDNFTRFDSNDLVNKLPLNILQNLFSYLNIYNLFSIDRSILELSSKQNSNRIQILLKNLNSIWKVHFQTLWHFYAEDLNFIQLYKNSDKLAYKCLYFEHLFNETKAFQLDLSILLNNGIFVNILDLSLIKIKQYQITRASLVLRMRSTLDMTQQTKNA